MRKGLSVLVGITCVVVIITMAVIAFSVWRLPEEMPVTSTGGLEYAINDVRKELGYISNHLFFIQTRLDNDSSHFITTIPHDPEIEIALARESAMYENAFVSVMLSSFDPSTKYEYFLSTNGRPTVEITGKITYKQQIKDFCIIAQNYRKSDETPDSYFSTNRLTNVPVYYEGLQEISFRIQLRKVFASDEVKYNHYTTGYTEISWKNKDGIVQTVSTQSDFIYRLFDECIKRGWNV